MKKLIRLTVPKEVLKRFDVDVKEGRRAAKIAELIDANRNFLLKRAAAKTTKYEIVSTLVDEKDIALLKKVARAEGTSLGEVLGRML